jgi:anti-sigma factor RsiW
MSCSEIRPLLSARLDGELDAARAEPVSAHLASCPACRAYLADLAELSDRLRAGRQVELPAGLGERIVAAAHARRFAAPLRRPRLQLWFVRAAAVAAGFAGYWLGYHGVVASFLRVQARSPAVAAQVESLLHETAAALAGHGLVGSDEFVVLDRRPEARLLQELTPEVKP